MFRPSLARALRAARPLALAPRPAARALTTIPRFSAPNAPPRSRAASSTPHGDPSGAPDIEVR